MKGYIPIEEQEALGHSFPNLNTYSVDIELKLTWKNKIEINKLNIKH